MNKFNKCNPFPCAFPEFLGATESFLPIHGVFFTFDVGPFVPSGVSTTGTVIPTQISDPPLFNTSSAFNVNSDGSVTVNIAGVYIVDARVNLAPGSSGSFAVQVNGGGSAVPFLNAFSNTSTVGSTSSHLITQSNILNLAAGDIVSIGLIGGNPSPVLLTTSPIVINTPSASLRFLKVK